MISWITRFMKKRRLKREQETLDELKARYHNFRAVLHCNERSLELLSAFDEALHKGKELSPVLSELLSETFELVDGLNRLSYNQYPGLYSVHDHIAHKARRAVTELDETSADSPLTLALAVPLTEVGLEQAPLIGGKAASLGEMLRSGAPVPHGFALTTNACRIFLEQSGTSEHIEHLLRPVAAGAGDILETAQMIYKLILSCPLPEELSQALDNGWSSLGRKPVSVRSSALVEDHPAHSFAGQFVSCLNIRDKKALITAYREVIASNFGARPLTYRIQAGLPVVDFNMGVIVQGLVDARAAGVLFTIHPSKPESGRMLLTAVPGLGTQAVGGSAPADIYQPLRENPQDVQRTLTKKTIREASDRKGGLKVEAVPLKERNAELLFSRDIAELLRWGHFAELLFGGPQDMEWALDKSGRIFILQSRSIPLRGKAIRVATKFKGKTITNQGICASSGRSSGRAKIILSPEELSTALPGGPVILVLSQSFADAARLIPELEGLIVELGNPTDHLSCVAREYALPMLTGSAGATRLITEDTTVILDADDHLVMEAPENIKEILPRRRRPQALQHTLSPQAGRLRKLIATLNLTDAYGPTFSIQECRSLHDIIRFSHEKTLINMFNAGDIVLEEADSLVKWINGLPLSFLTIDLGGGLGPDLGRKIKLADVLCLPLRAICEGMNSPDLRWSDAPPVLAASGMMSRAIFNSGGERPVGSQNYALITREYMNLNARVDYHFAMVDSMCGPNQQENYVRFRFKGGGMKAIQRERRARFIKYILRAHSMLTNLQGDLVTASIGELPMKKIQELLRMLGCLLGFSRLMDGAMINDKAPQKAAQAFLQGNFSMKGVDFQE